MFKHTPLPWKMNLHEAVGGNDYITILKGSWDIAHTKYSARDWEEEKANAEFIIEACNNYERIKQELKNCLSGIEAMKSGVAIRIAGLEKRIKNLS